MNEKSDELITQLNKETAKLPWAELERHFARGSVVKVSSEMDLINVAVTISNDDKPALEALMEEGKVANASIEDAKVWNECSTEFWAVVIAPWVLVQPIEKKLDS